MRNFEIEAYNIILDITCDYTPAEQGDYDYPGYPAEIDILQIESVGGEDLTELILEHIVGSEQYLRELIMDKYEL